MKLLHCRPFTFAHLCCFLWPTAPELRNVQSSSLKSGCIEAQRPPNLQLLLEKDDGPINLLDIPLCPSGLEATFLRCGLESHSKMNEIAVHAKSRVKDG